MQAKENRGGGNVCEKWRQMQERGAGRSSKRQMMEAGGRGKHQGERRPELVEEVGSGCYISVLQG